MKIKFWGTRGSIPAPLVADEFRAKAKRLLMNAAGVDLSSEHDVDAYLDAAPKPLAMTFGGNTPCLEITGGDEQLVFDCGSGLRMLGRQMKQEGLQAGDEIHIFQTHTHWDHLIGFPFFVPAYTAGVTINVYGVHPRLEERFAQQMDLVHFPITMDDMAATIKFHQLEAGETMRLGTFSVTNKGLNHPGGSYAYKVTSDGTSIVYATDGEYKEPTDAVYQPYIDFFTGADLVVFDSMYATLERTVEMENYGHSTAVIGIGLALSAGVKKLVLFHHDPEMNDQQIVEAYNDALEYKNMAGKLISESPLELISSYDGLEIEV